MAEGFNDRKRTDAGDVLSNSRRANSVVSPPVEASRALLTSPVAHTSAAIRRLMKTRRGASRVTLTKMRVSAPSRH